MSLAWRNTRVTRSFLAPIITTCSRWCGVQCPTLIVQEWLDFNALGMADSLPSVARSTRIFFCNFIFPFFYSFYPVDIVSIFYLFNIQPNKGQAEGDIPGADTLQEQVYWGICHTGGEAQHRKVDSHSRPSSRCRVQWLRLVVWKVGWLTSDTIGFTCS